MQFYIESKDVHSVEFFVLHPLQTSLQKLLYKSQKRDFKLKMKHNFF